MIPWSFLLLVLLFSLPCWLLAAIVGRLPPEVVPINLPVSALMAFNPLLAAAILVSREQGWTGVKALLGRALDYGRIRRTIWLVPALGLMPLTAVLEYVVLRLVRAPLPDPHVPVLAVPIMLVAFAVGAAGEELGWQGYVYDRLPRQWSALGIALVMGAVWGIWHAVPYIQAERPPAWIAWQVLGSVASRVLVVWIYANSGRSVFAVSLFHATINVSAFLFPNYGSHYDPFIVCLIVTAMAGAAAYLWGPSTLAHFRYRRAPPAGAGDGHP